MRNQIIKDVEREFLEPSFQYLVKTDLKIPLYVICVRLWTYLTEACITGSRERMIFT